MLRAERADADEAHRKNGDIQVPASFVGRGSLAETVWITRTEAKRLYHALERFKETLGVL